MWQDAKLGGTDHVGFDGVGSMFRCDHCGAVEELNSTTSAKWSMNKDFNLICDEAKKQAASWIDSHRSCIQRDAIKRVLALGTDAANASTETYVGYGAPDKPDKPDTGFDAEIPRKLAQDVYDQLKLSVVERYSKASELVAGRIPEDDDSPMAMQLRTIQNGFMIGYFELMIEYLKGTLEGAPEVLQETMEMARKHAMATIIVASQNEERPWTVKRVLMQPISDRKN